MPPPISIKKTWETLFLCNLSPPLPPHPLARKIPATMLQIRDWSRIASSETSFNWNKVPRRSHLSSRCLLIFRTFTPRSQLRQEGVALLMRLRRLPLIWILLHSSSCSREFTLRLQTPCLWIHREVRMKSQSEGQNMRPLDSEGRDRLLRVNQRRKCRLRHPDYYTVHLTQSIPTVLNLRYT